MNEIEIYEKFCINFFNFNSYTGNSINNYYIDKNESYFSVFNNYIPSFAIFNRRILDSEREVVEYFKIKNNEGYPTRNYTTLVNNLRANIYTPRTFNLNKDNFQSTLTSNQGVLIDENGLLYCFCIKREFVTEMFKIYTDRHKSFVDNFNLDNFKIYISNRIKEPRYKSLYNALDKVLLDRARKIDLDFTFTNSIESKVYNGIPPNFINLKFKSVSEMKMFLENYLPSLI